MRLFKRSAHPRGKKKTVLMVAYHFPPDASSGTFRSLKFAKYLRDFDWEVVVLTIAPEHEPLENKDPELLSEVPPGVRVERTFAWSPVKSRMRLIRGAFRRVCFPDRFMGWYPFAVWRGWLLARQHNVQVIYTSSPPFTSALVGLTLRLLTSIPLVSDFRDPWIGNTYKPQLSPLRNRVARWLERQVFHHSARVLNTSSELTAGAALRNRMADEGKFVTITNGFDPADFLNSSPATVNKEFRITYTGTFYPGAREPYNFLRGLAWLARRNPEEVRQLSCWFVGEATWAAQHAEFLDKLALGDHIQFVPFRTHRESLQLLAESNALLMLGNVKRQDTGTLPAKLFEYLAAKRPILALVHTGESAEFVRASGIGAIANPEDPEEIGRVLLQMYRDIRAGRFPSEPNPKLLKQYSRKELTRQLAALFDTVIRPTQQG